MQPGAAALSRRFRRPERGTDVRTEALARLSAGLALETTAHALVRGRIGRGNWPGPAAAFVARFAGLAA